MSLTATPEPVHLEHVGREVHLGKREQKKDARNLKFARYVTRAVAALPTTPGHVRRTDAVDKAKASWPMYANDSLPDCTAAAAGHMVEAWTAAAQPSITVPSDADVLALFDATGPRDEGRYELDVLNYWRKTGLAGRKIRAFVEVNPKNAAHMQLAIWLFGGVYAGLALPSSAQTQSRPDGVWTVGRGAAGAPGSWGGHAVPILNYWRSRSRYSVVTWGYVQVMTAGFWTHYGDEAYAIVTDDWLNAAGEAPAVPGFNVAKLLADLDAINAA